jgi:N-acetylglucosamine-6-phosphate deacetylase
MITHLFNAQRPIGHREPGIPGAGLVDDRLFLGLIADLHHVALDMVRLSFAAAADRVVLVTDALASAGMPPGVYELGGESIVVDEAGQPARRLDGTLSGSGLTLAAAVRNCTDLGIPLDAALRSATSIPAATLGRFDVGSLQPGAFGDLVWFDDELQVRAVWMDGRALTASA